MVCFVKWSVLMRNAHAVMNEPKHAKTAARSFKLQALQDIYLPAETKLAQTRGSDQPLLCKHGSAASPLLR